jgi:hypothetical protein
MRRARAWTRWILLGPDDSWGATLATGRLGITALALLALLLHVLDLATGVRMMLARNCLLIAAGIGLLGFASNMVG